MNGITWRLVGGVVLLVLLVVFGARTRQKRTKAGPSGAAPAVVTGEQIVAVRKQHARRMALCSALGTGTSECVKQLAVEAREPVLCELAAPYLDACRADVAQQVGDASVCPQGPARGACLVRLAATPLGVAACRDAVGNDAKVCEAVASRSVRACAGVDEFESWRCTVAVAVATADASLCSQGRGADNTVLRFGCIRDVAMAAGRSDLCQGIPNPGIYVDGYATHAHQDCLAYTQRVERAGVRCVDGDPTCSGREAFQKKDTGACKDPRGRSDDACLLTYAALSGGNLACAGIQAPQMRAACEALPPP